MTPFLFKIIIRKIFFLYLDAVQQVEEALEAVKNATNEQDLTNPFKELGKEKVKLNYAAASRQQ